MSNQAAWLSAPAAQFNVGEAPMPTPGDHEVVIRNYAVAFNPVDFTMHQKGLFIAQYPAVLGVDGAGEISAIGSSVTQFKVGDRVLAMFDGSTESKSTNTAYQLYAATSEKSVAKISTNVSYAQASVLPLGFATALDALYSDKSFNIPSPQLERNPKPNGKTFLVWGASSSVGANGVQLAKAAGFEVAATAGASNKEFCQGLGARHVFDHRQEGVVDTIVQALKGKEFGGIFCAIMDVGVLNQCAAITKQLGGPQAVATVIPPMFPPMEGLTEGIEWIKCNSENVRKEPQNQAIWTEWLPAALESGIMQCKPDPLVVGKGLEEIQKGSERMGAGVSGQKVVVELP